MCQRHGVKCGRGGTPRTSRPSQNSASLSCWDMTSSRCRFASSLSVISTAFLSSKSFCGSCRIMVSPRLLSPCGRLGMGLGRAVFVVGVPGTEIGVIGAGEGASDEPRLALIIAVSSRLKRSRSPSATCCGVVKVNVYSSFLPVSPILILTCADPSLLQNKAENCGSL
jgi:hypothetical protein